MRFTRALVRPPPPTFAAGISSWPGSPPYLALALEQHQAYCRALAGLGLALVALPPDANFADSTFVEDTAIVTSRGAILTRPGAASRTGEVASVEAPLREWFPELGRITAPGTLDGGDVCEVGQSYFIGISTRTNEQGASQLARWLATEGFISSLIDIRGIAGLLHLKTGLSWLGGRRLLAVAALAEHDALREWEVVRVPDGEDYAANCLLVNGKLLVADGFPGASALLSGLGYDLTSLAMSEFQKMDGGLSCLSVRW
jgi:dimethylargininase